MVYPPKNNLNDDLDVIGATEKSNTEKKDKFNFLGGGSFPKVLEMKGFKEVDVKPND